MRRTLFIGALVTACGPRVPVDADGDEESGALVTSTSTSTSTSSTSSADTTTSTSGAAGTSSSSTADGCAFVCASDVGDAIVECDEWAQDCPVGQKCMPWANDGGYAWNATRCVPIADDPAQPGEPCTVQGNGFDGIDDCDIASMCWNPDPVMMIGYCVAFCQGSEDDPSCADPAAECEIANDGVLIICLPLCNPLTQNCDDGQGCYPIGNAFACAADAPGSADLGGPCEFLNVCDAGQFCADPSDVQGCVSPIGCCTTFCDLTAADPDAGCFLPAQVCVPWFEPGHAPAGFTNLGYCTASP
jgi:hypothetical protein